MSDPRLTDEKIAEMLDGLVGRPHWTTFPAAKDTAAALIELAQRRAQQGPLEALAAATAEPVRVD